MPDGSKLSYEIPARLVNEVGNVMNCNCARDEKIFKDKGIQFYMRCKYNGNYENLQDQNGKLYCVDSYGFAVSGLLEPESGNACDMFIYTEQEDIFEEDIDDEEEYWK
jgi:Thyroglobulin type-1 repeat